MRGVGRGLTVARTFTANLLFILLVLFVVAIFVSGGGAVSVPEHGALVLAPTGTIVEQDDQSSLRLRS